MPLPPGPSPFPLPADECSGRANGVLGLVMAGRMLRLAVAVLSSFSVAFAAPALAIAHGHAHEEIAAHASDAHGEATHGEFSRLDVDAEHDGHGHPAIQPGASSRVQQVLPAAGVLQPFLELLELTDGCEAEPPVPNESPPGLNTVSAARPRAPPAPLTV